MGDIKYREKKNRLLERKKTAKNVISKKKCIFATEILLHIMNQNAKSKIDWETILEVLIFIVSAIKELVKKANEQESESKKDKEIGNQDKEIES